MGKVYQDDRAISTDLKNAICPYCKNELNWIYDDVCDICHRHLVNRCTRCDHTNPNNARYCELCGAETFFLTENILFAFDTPLSPEDIKRIKNTRLEFYKNRDHNRGIDYDSIDVFPREHGNLMELENPMVLDWLWNDEN